MLSDLVDTIESLKLRIQEHGASLREYEIRTRMALIEPWLRVLGWDVSDQIFVIPEYEVGKGRGDYALLGPNGKPVAIVEEKKLGEKLEQHVEQMTTYSYLAGIPYAGITDGAQWKMYEVFKQSKNEERQILELSVKNDPSHESALKLLLLWNRNLETGRPIPALTPIELSKPPPPVQPPKPLLGGNGDE